MAYLDNRDSKDLSIEEDEYLGEDSNAIYDCKTGILMLQYNRYGVSPKSLEYYVNRIWDNRDDYFY